MSSNISTKQLEELRDRSRKLSHSSIYNLDEFLHQVVSVAADAVGAEMATVLLIDERESKLSFASVSGPVPEELHKISLPIDSSLAGWILTEREPLIVDDLETTSQEYSKIGARTFDKVRSLLGVPMVVDDKPIGVIEVMNKKEGEFSESDTEVLQALALVAAVAVENVRLFDEARRGFQQKPITSSSTPDWWERLSPRHYAGLALAAIIFTAGAVDVLVGLATPYHLLPWITDLLIVLGSMVLALETILLVQD